MPFGGGGSSRLSVVGGDVAVGGAGHQEAAVGVGLARRRAEPAVGQRRTCARASRRTAAPRRSSSPSARSSSTELDEPVHLAAVDLLVGGVPGLRRRSARLRGGRERERGAPCPSRSGSLFVALRRRGRTSGRPPCGWPRARQRAEQVVERVVLHHHARRRGRTACAAVAVPAGRLGSGRLPGTRVAAIALALMIALGRPGTARAAPSAPPRLNSPRRVNRKRGCLRSST